MQLYVFVCIFNTLNDKKNGGGAVYCSKFNFASQIPSRDTLLRLANLTLAKAVPNLSFCVIDYLLLAILSTQIFIIFSQQN